MISLFFIYFYKQNLVLEPEPKWSLPPAQTLFVIGFLLILMGFHGFSLMFLILVPKRFVFQDFHWTYQFWAPNRHYFVLFCLESGNRLTKTYFGCKKLETTGNQPLVLFKMLVNLETAWLNIFLELEIWNQRFVLCFCL